MEDVGKQFTFSELFIFAGFCDITEPSLSKTIQLPHLFLHSTSHHAACCCSITDSYIYIDFNCISDGMNLIYVISLPFPQSLVTLIVLLSNFLDRLPRMDLYLKDLIKWHL